ncbi:unnamed protein product [Meganyctiphanes norvegica]|uniref:Uncharacterized protein n=1 Tax=Meganyctiphanes norvegica TaxID=48144 RepID=A0AAV2R8A0_MEGNR
MKYIFLALLLVQTAWSLSCFVCVSKPSIPNNPDYDPNCELDGYTGATIESNSYYSCWTAIYDTGEVNRGHWSGDNYVDGECIMGTGYVSCYCTTDNCNSNLCQHCETD